jgi:hypothetical protein
VFNLLVPGTVCACAVIPLRTRRDDWFVLTRSRPRFRMLIIVEFIVLASGVTGKLARVPQRGLYERLQYKLPQTSGPRYRHVWGELECNVTQPHGCNIVCSRSRPNFWLRTRLAYAGKSGNMSISNRRPGSCRLLYNNLDRIRHAGVRGLS